MSLAKILAARKRKRNFYDGGGPDPNAGEGGVGGVEGPGGVGGTSGGGPDPNAGEGGVGGVEGPGGVGGTSGGGPDPNAGEGGVGGVEGPGGVGGTSRGGADPGNRFSEYAESVLGVLGKMPGGLGVVAGLVGKGIAAAKQDRAARETDSARFGITMPSRDQDNGEGGMGTGLGADAAANPFGSSTPTQTTPATPTDAGMRRYVWDPVARQYTLTNVGGGANPMGYTAGQTFRMAAGGAAPAGLAAARTQPRFVQGGGTGLSDDVPVKMDDGGDGRLADGEFVIPADVVSGLGGGSSKAGADMLYQMMERIRQAAHGKSQQIRPVDPSRVLPV